MSETYKPVILDETGQKLVEAIEGLSLREGANKELLEEIKTCLNEISGKMSDESKVYVATITETYDSSLKKTTFDVGDVTYASVKEAFEHGKSVFLRVLSSDASDGSGGALIPLSEVQENGIKFITHSAIGKPVKYTGLYVITTENVVQFFTSPLGAANVSCEVTVAGTTYYNVYDALNAIAKELGT